MMKLLVVFVCFVGLITQVEAFKALEEIDELTQENVDQFFDNFAALSEAFLDSQRPSVNSPLQQVVNCASEDLGTIRKKVKDLLTAVLDGHSLDKRKKLCAKDNVEVVDNLHICLDKHASPKAMPFINTLKSAMYLPFHEICTYEDPHNHLTFIQNIEKGDLKKKYQASYDRYLDILEKGEEITVDDECLPFILSAAYHKVMTKSDIFDPLARGMFEQALRIYFIVKAKFPFRSFTTCSETLKNL